MVDDEDKDLHIEDRIEVFGARVHNLRNIDVSIPRNQLCVITGLSGSGKSSLAFDTIYAEGQRRYIETFSAYARQFLGNLERPDVDKITGLSPVISIEQKSTSKNPRSTVGTITEIYDFLRLLFARAGEAYSYVTGEKMVKYTEDQIIELIFKSYGGKSIFVLAPVIKGRKGHYKEFFEQIRKKGFLQVRVDGTIKDISPNLQLDRYKNHFIEIVIDKLKVPAFSAITNGLFNDTPPEENPDLKRLRETLRTAMHHGQGIIMLMDKSTQEIKYFSRQLMCPTTGIAYDEPAPHSFSFNSPQGACPVCRGLGVCDEIDFTKIIPDSGQSIYQGGIEPLGQYKSSMIFWQLEAIAAKYNFTLKTPVRNIPEEALEIILHGSNESFYIENSQLGSSFPYMFTFNGILDYIMQMQNNVTSKKAQKWAEQYIKTIMCKECGGQRLKKESLHYKIYEKNIAQLADMDIKAFYDWLEMIEGRQAGKSLLSQKQLSIAQEILKEIRTRLSFLLGVGLDYLSLNRSAASLSGGESQRIRLATQIGSQLVNVLYILDEPSIGLHQRDNIRLINSLRQLRDSGNSVIVVEHDKEMIMSADYLLDIGPSAGIHGGEVVAQGTPQEVLKTNTLTAQYLNGEKEITVPKKRRKGNGHHLTIVGATGNNLKNVSAKFPLGIFICITGVSGSGKSSLINETLQPILSQKFYNSLKDPLPYQSLDGIEHIDKVIEVDQSPIGRTPRSNPATYTDVFTDIRKLFERLPESQIRGYSSGRFSFNVKGGRCETCQGAGVQTIEMNFLPDVYVPCPDCYGMRYNRETLEVRFKGKSISDILNMTINVAVEFFESIPSILQKIKTLQDVGLGYITLGQPSTTLSGGEAQRIKLAAELSKRSTGKTLYILDEPTTGLHFEDIRVLLDVLNRLVDKGNTVIVIEHNLDVIKVADFIIDMGKDGGRGGGEVICTGTPEEIAHNKESYTAIFLKQELKKQKN